MVNLVDLPSRQSLVVDIVLRCVLVEVFRLSRGSAEELSSVCLNKLVIPVVLKNQIKHQIPSLVHSVKLHKVQLVPSSCHGAAQRRQLLALAVVHLLNNALQRHPDFKIQHLCCWRARALMHENTIEIFLQEVSSSAVKK